MTFTGEMRSHLSGRLPVFRHEESHVMPASKADISELRSLQYFLEHPDRYYPNEVKRQHIVALKRMLRTIEGGDPDSPVWWAAGALIQSMRKVNPGMYIVVDRTLQTWALDQLFSFFPDARDAD